MAREPSRLAGLVKKIIKDYTKKRRLTEEEMLEIWESAAGRRAAAHAHPVSIRRSVLVVNVDDSSWLYELTLKKREILKALEEGFAGKKLKGIRFRIGEVKKGGT